MSEKELEEKLAEYKKLASEDKKVDLAGLMMAELDQQNTNSVSAKHKRWAYLVSLLFPPFGLFFAARYYFSDKSDGHQVAIVCVALTVVSFFLLWLVFQGILAGTGTDLQQIEQINPQDIRDLYQ